MTASPLAAWRRVGRVFGPEPTVGEVTVVDRGSASSSDVGFYRHQNSVEVTKVLVVRVTAGGGRGSPFLSTRITHIKPKIVSHSTRKNAAGELAGLLELRYTEKRKEEDIETDDKVIMSGSGNRSSGEDKRKSKDKGKRRKCV
ncbi:hypothetical protein Dimus_017309 [Dionaea muscipula]